MTSLFFKLLPSPPRLLLLQLRVPCRKSLQTRGHKSTRSMTTTKRSGRTRQIQNQIRIPILYHHQTDLHYQECHHYHHHCQYYQEHHHRHHHYQEHRQCHHHQCHCQVHQEYHHC